MTDKQLSAFLDFVIPEDLGDGDHTSLSCIPHDHKGKARLLVKENGILAGVDVAKAVFARFDPECRMEIFLNDGAAIKPGDVAFYVHLSTRQLLTAERLVLNIMQRMSGIATQTKLYVEALEGLHTRILDTRKTTPGNRFLEKEAVRIGGAVNHRFGLYDMILIKDNHIDFAGGIKEAIQKTKEYLSSNGKDLKIEVEARSIADIHTILEAGDVFRILIDNFTTQMTREAVELIGRRVETESSGGITLKNIREYAECGVDYISVGALTHQIKSLDLSLKAIDT
jgi:nicotinate-nucleotide pyrophosphorylase (carboxylating)